MVAQLQTLVRKKFPFRPRLFAYGVVGGGLLSLVGLVTGQSADLAATAGLAGCVSIAVGIWIGTILAKWSLHFTSRRISTALMLVGEAYQNLRPNSVAQGQAEALSEVQDPWHQRVWTWIMIDLPVFFLLLAPVFVLLVLLDLGYGLYDLNVFRFVALGAGGFALGSLGGLVMHHLVISQLVRRLTRLTQPASMDLSQPRIARPDRKRQQTRVSQKVLSFQKAMDMVPVWFERFFGVPVDEVAPEGFPHIAA